MYDTKTRIALVKKRMHEYHRRQERRAVCYVLVAVISFNVAVVITALCIKFRKRGQKSQDAEDHV